ncbi:MAG: T9SS type A sorting domain-containing protein [Bacteroidales bacterium]|nr:MAG: T9SS type A sorting domain-containing protein [Bacteroidales bacterium]
MKKAISFFLFFLMFPLSMFTQEISQEIISSSGDYSDGSSGQLSWTLGDLATETYSSGDIKLTQGFQQPTIEVTPTFESRNYNIVMRVYPVPSSDFVTVEFEEIQKDMKVVLFNLQGEVVTSKILESATITLDLNSLSPSEYILKIINKENDLIKSYKIVKH